MSEGWITLHRKIRNHWTWKDPVKFKAWVTILLEVNHEPNTVNIDGKIIKCDRGESVKSLDTWARIFGANWNKSKVRRFLKLLESDTMIELKPERKTTHLRVCNYDSYQVGRNKDEPKVKRRRNKDESKLTLNNNENNENNENKVYSFEDFWKAYNKKVAKEKCLNKWDTLSSDDKSKIESTVYNFVSSHSDKKYLPHPITYLNQKRWNDEYSEASTASITERLSNYLNLPLDEKQKLQKDILTIPVMERTQREQYVATEKL